MNNTHEGGNWVRRALIAACVFLSVLLVVLVAATAYMEQLLGLIGREPAQLETLSPEEIEALLHPEDSGGYDPEEIPMPPAAPVIEGEHLVQILLIGQDRRGSTGRSLSDAMILCTLNLKNKSLTLTSFLRDTYVQIPGYRNNKLNVAYPLGGMPLLDQTLEVNYGVKVDGNIEVDFSQFAQIIDLLGGVSITLTQAEAEHLNHQYGFTLQPGENRLNGQEALGYSRIRRIGTDFGRTNRQRTVLMALIEEFRDAGMTRLHKTLTGILGLITTDMTDAQIVSYGLKLAPLLRDIEVRSQYIPAEGTFRFEDVAGVGNCIFVDFEANRALLAASVLE
jgi:LCP family protein required for cell wall assembly